MRQRRHDPARRQYHEARDTLPNMLHLSTDRLAALGDDTPTPDEASHLALCAECASERAAFVSLVSMAAAERESFGLPLTRWDAIAAELGQAPIVAMPAAPSNSTPVVTLASRRPGWWTLRVAAALLLMAGGAMMGRASVGATPLPVTGETTRAAVASVSPLSLMPADSMAFTSVEQARIAQQRSEQLFQQAAAYLSASDTNAANVASPVAYRSRLSALDRVISTTREALREAPHDPVINNYYLSTLGQREATLRQLNTALPVSLRLDSF
jgi:hypothetical protein